MQRVWSFKGAAYGCFVGLLVGTLVAFINLMTPSSEPSVANAGGSSGNDDPVLSGFGGDSYLPPSGNNRFGFGSQASQLASLAFELDGEEHALRILEDLERDPRDRLFALKQYLGDGSQPPEAVLKALDGIRQQLDAGWQVELDRRPEPVESSSGMGVEIDDLAWEVGLTTDRLKLRLDLVRIYQRVGQQDAAKSLLSAAESDLQACNDAAGKYNLAVAQLHRRTPEDPWDRAALWPAVLSVFGFMLTGISHPILQAIGGGVVARTKTRREEKA